MTRGGNRNPHGRPKSTEETRTANLCGIRVKPTQLRRYKEAAGENSMTLSQWATWWLDFAADKALGEEP